MPKLDKSYKMYPLYYLLFVHYFPLKYKVAKKNNQKKKKGENISEYLKNSVFFTQL